MAWNPIDDPIDYILLNDQRSPGVAMISGAGTPRKWQKQQGFGLSGAIVFFTGLDLSTFEVTLQLATVDDWNDWHDWKSLVQKPPLGTRPRALTIWHPFLEDLDIKSVVVEDMMQPEVSDTMMGTIKIKFLQYRRPRPSFAKPDGAGNKTLTPTEAEIAINNTTITGQLTALGLDVPISGLP
jgi:hypothetical protein